MSPHSDGDCLGMESHMCSVSPGRWSFLLQSTPLGFFPQPRKLLIHKPTCVTTAQLQKMMGSSLSCPMAQAHPLGGEGIPPHGCSGLLWIQRSVGWQVTAIRLNLISPHWARSPCSFSSHLACKSPAQSPPLLLLARCACMYVSEPQVQYRGLILPLHQTSWHWMHPWPTITASLATQISSSDPPGRHTGTRRCDSSWEMEMVDSFLLLVEIYIKLF